MNPDNTQLGGQTEDSQPLQPVPSPQPQTAGDPMGPRPVPPVYEPVVSGSPSIPTPQLEGPVVQGQPVGAAQPQIAELPVQEAVDQNSGLLVLPPPPEGVSTDQSPQPILGGAPSQDQVSSALPLQNFSAPAAGNQSIALANPNKGPQIKKIILLAISALGGLVAVGIIVFLVMNLFGGDKVKLKKYTNDDFSISYPIDMGVKKDEAGVEISKSPGKDGSKITIVKPLSLNTPAKETMKLYKDQITQQEDGDDSITIVSSKETKINGMEAVVIIAKEKTDSVTKDSKLVLIASKDDKVMYLIGFENYPNDTDVVALSDDILKSFSIKTE